MPVALAFALGALIAAAVATLCLWWGVTHLGGW
jgi:hypothetical protein